LWNAFTNADSNGYCNCYRDGHSYGDRNGHTDRNFNSHANSYRYGKTHSNPETPSHTKATSDPSASSVTGNSRLEKSKANEQTNVILEKFLNQEMRNPLSRKENSCFPD
jgi:hypothetical protein